MTEISKNPSIFEKITSFDYLRKKPLNLPKVNLSKAESDREVNVIEATLAKYSTPPKSNNNKTAAGCAMNSASASKGKVPSTPSKLTLSERKTPTAQRRLNFTRDSPMSINMADMKNLSNFKAPSTSDHFLPLKYNFKINNKDSDNSDKSSFLEINKDGVLRKKEEFNTKDGHIALNFNLALNMSSKKDIEQSETNDDRNSMISISDTHSAVKVAVRMRPLSEDEKAKQGDDIKEILIRDHQVFIPQKKDYFDFDYCLNSANPELFNYASQEVVYRKIGEPLLEQAMKGYNTCLFAYGQSGSGKTYTMTGTPENPGIIPRFINDLFRKINSYKDIEFTINVSFLEIYKEQINDLLADEFSISSELRVREHPQTGPYVEGLTVITVENSDNAMELLHTGLKRRATAASDKNEKSSRSHSIFSIILVQNKRLNGIDHDAPNSETSRISKINLVDLAGSERITCDVTDGRFREGILINKSLLTLGKVITQLAGNAHSTSKVGHVPYRESVLTYLLKDSLGGNSRTSMIATISPAKTQLEETMSTLRYASTTQKIVNIVHVNEDPKIKIINGLLKQISFLRKEVDRSKTENSMETSGGIEQDLINEKLKDYSDKITANMELIKASIQQLFDNNMKKFKDLFQEVLNNQKSLLESFDQVKVETSELKKHIKHDAISFNYNVVDELKAAIKAVKNENLFKHDHEYDKIMNEMQTKFDDNEEIPPQKEEKIEEKVEVKGKKGKNKNKQEKKENEKIPQMPIVKHDLPKEKEQEIEDQKLEVQKQKSSTNLNSIEIVEEISIVEFSSNTQESSFIEYSSDIRESAFIENSNVDNEQEHVGELESEKKQEEPIEDAQPTDANVEIEKPEEKEPEQVEEKPDDNCDSEDDKKNKKNKGKNKKEERRNKKEANKKGKNKHMEEAVNESGEFVDAPETPEKKPDQADNKSGKDVDEPLASFEKEEKEEGGGDKKKEDDDENWEDGGKKGKKGKKQNKGGKKGKK